MAVKVSWNIRKSAKVVTYSTFQFSKNPTSEMLAAVPAMMPTPKTMFPVDGS